MSVVKVKGKNARLSVETVDYNDDGQVTVGGKSDPGVSLNLYLDNNFSGKTIASDKGVWHIAPQKNLKPGLYNLRVDYLNKSGKVIARVETRFARAGIIKGVIEEGVFLVQPGNSLWRIARRGVWQRKTITQSFIKLMSIKFAIRI